MALGGGRSKLEGCGVAAEAKKRQGASLRFDGAGGSVGWLAMARSPAAETLEYCTPRCESAVSSVSVNACWKTSGDELGVGCSDGKK